GFVKEVRISRYRIPRGSLYFAPAVLAMMVPLSAMLSFTRMGLLQETSADISRTQWILAIVYISGVSMIICTAFACYLSSKRNLNFFFGGPALAMLSIAAFSVGALNEYLYPVTGPRWMGAIALIMMWSGGVVSILYAAFGLPSERRSGFVDNRYRSFQQAARRVVLVYFVNILTVVFLAVKSATLLPGGFSETSSTFEDFAKNGGTMDPPRWSLKGGFEQWVELRRYKKELPSNGHDKYPVFVVSAQGGGYYASYYAALLLATIQDACPEFSSHVFAVSGVSGGALGVGVYKGVSELSRLKGRYASVVRRFFAQDFLTPVISAL